MASRPSVPTARPAGTDGRIRPHIEALRAAWLDAADPGEQRRICAELQQQLWQDPPFIPIGEYRQATAYRRDLTDVLYYPVALRRFIASVEFSLTWERRGAPLPQIWRMPGGTCRPC